MRFSDVLTLETLAYGQDDDGNVVETPDEREVFFNPYSISLQARVIAQSEGLHGLLTGEVMACDYDGQKTARHAGRRYTVTGASDKGDYTVLTMKERLGNE